MKKDEYAITGMTCATCANTIETQVKKVPGVSKAKVSLALNYLKVEADDEITKDQIIKAVKDAGYGAEQIQKEFTQKRINKESKILLIKFCASIFLTFWMWLGMIFMLVDPMNNFGMFLNNPIFQIVITLIIEFVIGSHFFKDFYHGMKNRRANMSFLVVMGTLAALGLSIYNATVNGWVTNMDGEHLYFETAATIITLVLLGKIFEEIAKNKTTNSLKSLTKLLPTTAIKMVDGKETEIDVKEVKVGDILIIKPGASIPLDGKVVKGESHINESMLTGESKSVKKTKGSIVTGATINQEGFLEIQVTKVGDNTTLAKIIGLVKDAQSSDIEIQKIVDKIAAWFIPVVIILAIGTFIGWWIWYGEVNQNVWSNSIAVLVIACPCALGLATPTAIMVGTGRAAQLGILFKGGNFLEKMAKLDTIVFDKTGTLTEGKMVVETFKNFTKKYEDDKIIELLKNMENKSSHPIASAIKNFKPELNKNSNQEIKDFKTITSHGIQGLINKDFIQIGKPTWFKENKSFTKEIKGAISGLENKGHTVFVIAINDEVTAICSISDPIKKNAKELISKLKEMNINVALLTGDSELTAKAVGGELGIETIWSNVLVEQKAQYIKGLQAQKKIVAMIGDGINDTVALTQADIGISINTGVEIAIDSSDIVIMDDDLLRIVGAIQAAKKTLNKIKSNLFWAFIYNVAVIPLAMFGILVPEIAAAVMALQSVSVVTNSLFLNVKVKDKKNKNKVQK